MVSNYYLEEMYEMEDTRLMILGTTYTIDRYSANRYIAFLKDIINSLDKPFIVSFTGFPEFKLNEEYHHYSISRVSNYLLSLSDIEDGSFQEKIIEIADEDTEWTIHRNEELKYIAYRKYTLKPHVQKLAMEKFNEVIKEIADSRAVGKKAETEEFLKNQVRENLYRIVKVYDKQMPQGGENGVDGFLDVDIQGLNDESIRFIAKDIFDFGSFCFPKRFDGTDDVLNREKWTEEEHKMSRWLNEFSPFSKASSQEKISMAEKPVVSVASKAVTLTAANVVDSFSKRFKKHMHEPLQERTERISASLGSFKERVQNKKKELDKDRGVSL